MLHPLRLALLINLCAISVATAQPAARTSDFSGLGAGRDVVVINDAGQTTEGRLLRFTPESLTIAVRDAEVSFERQAVSTVLERGDSLRNGMKNGAIAGGGFGAFVGIGLASWVSCDYDGCNPASGILVAAIPTAIFGLMGLGAGAGIDALITSNRQLYERTPTARINGVPDDFSGLAAKRDIVVVDNAGLQTRGQLLRVTPEALTMTVDGKIRTFTEHDVMTIFERGDSVKNGTAIGLVTGAAVGFAAGASKTVCGRDAAGIGFITVFTSWSPCTAGERIGQGLREATLLGLFGSGLGATIDALIPGKRLLFNREQRTSQKRLSIAPTLTRSNIGLTTSVSW